MLSGKKVYRQIRPALTDNALKISSDKLFSLLSDHHLLIKPKRIYTTTTNSKHWLSKYPDILKLQTITQPDQAWMSDITYIKYGNS